MKQNHGLFCIIDSRYGQVGLVWTIQEGAAVVQQVLLPREDQAIIKVIECSWPGFEEVKGAKVPSVAEKIAAYLQGKQVIFSLNDLGREHLDPGFRQDVLRQTLRIPLGMVDTYGGLAAKIGHPKAARAVGTALANNPFPLVIPCHRVVRADGHIGCFGGGEPMKRRLLEMEGVSLDRAGRVVGRHFY